MRRAVCLIVESDCYPVSLPSPTTSTTTADPPSHLGSTTDTGHLLLYDVVDFQSSVKSVAFRVSVSFDCISVCVVVWLCGCVVMCQNLLSVCVTCILVDQQISNVQ